MNWDSFKNLFGISFIIVYSIFVLSFAVSEYRSAPKLTSNGKVLAAHNVVFPEEPGTPSLNKMSELIDQTRKNHGFKAFQLDKKLTEIAEARAKDMATRAYYAHKNPEGYYYFDMLKNTQFNNVYSCENLDLEFAADPQVYIDRWLTSTKGHRECLLNPAVSKVGYAIEKMDFGVPTKPTEETFVIVAIHAESPTN